jgi:predicted transposase YbfD/YdcC
MVIRTRQSDGKETGEVQFYLSSLKRNVKRFARAVRGHWGIENTCHWSLDMTFREDESRTRERHVAENLSWLRRFALGLIKQHPDQKMSLVMKRRACGWSTDFLTEILFSVTTECAPALGRRYEDDYSQVGTRHGVFEGILLQSNPVTRAGENARNPDPKDQLLRRFLNSQRPVSAQMSSIRIGDMGETASWTRVRS